MSRRSEQRGDYDEMAGAEFVVPADHLIPATRGQGHRVFRALVLTGYTIGLLALTAGACVLSYSGLHALASQAGVTGQLARGYPLLLDGAAVLAGIAVLALRGAGWFSRVFAWLSLLLLLAALMAGAAAHAAGITLLRRPAALTAAIVPWVLVLLAFSLLMVMLRYARIRHQGAAAGPADRRRAIQPGAPVVSAVPTDPAPRDPAPPAGIAAPAWSGSQPATIPVHRTPAGQIEAHAAEAAAPVLEGAPAASAAEAADSSGPVPARDGAPWPDAQPPPGVARDDTAGPVIGPATVSLAGPPAGPQPSATPIDPFTPSTPSTPGTPGTQAEGAAAATPLPVRRPGRARHAAPVDQDRRLGARVPVQRPAPAPTGDDAAAIGEETAVAPVLGPGSEDQAAGGPPGGSPASGAYQAPSGSPAPGEVPAPGRVRAAGPGAPGGAGSSPGADLPRRVRGAHARPGRPGAGDSAGEDKGEAGPPDFRRSHSSPSPPTG